MALRSSGTEPTAKPERFQAITCADSLDISETGPGGMIALQNLIPDPSTKNCWIARPAAFQLTNFPGFTTPGFISGLIQVGNYVVGMIATGLTAGYDQPFVYDIINNVFITITGVTAGNVPLSPPTSGFWTPPILALISAKVLIAHPGYSGTGTNFFGVIDMSTPTTPVYSTQNTSVNALPCPPISIAAFSNRAWYACNPPNAIPGLFFSDAGAPTTITNSGTAQVLTLNDSELITALGSLQYDNQLGGIVQALVAFKGIGNIYQITGDAALTGNNALALNTLNVATGTLAPLSITNTPKGMVFLSPDGFRLINSNGEVSDPLGADGAGICVPFIYSTQPTRVNATSNSKIVRVTTINGGITPGASQALASPFGSQEWWYDVSRQAWSGPHTMTWDQLIVYNDTFIGAPTGIPGSLWQADYKQRLTSTFTENGVQMQYVIQWCMVPEKGDMQQKEVVESYVLAAFDKNMDLMQCGAIDEYNNVLDSPVVNNPSNIPPSQWGTMIWGSGVWGSIQSLTPVAFPWTRPINFARASFFIKGNSNFGLEFGALWLRLNNLGYIKTQLADTIGGGIV